MDKEILQEDEGIFIRFNITLGGNSLYVFVMSENLARVEIKKIVDEYLKDPSDTFIHGDLHVEEEKCTIWKSSKPLKAKVNIVLVEIWESGCGSCGAFACRNEREIKEILRHVMNSEYFAFHKRFHKMNAKIYRDVPVLRIINATEKDSHAKINRVAALKREL